MNTENTPHQDLAWLGRALDARIAGAKDALDYAKETEDESGDAIDSIERGFHEGYLQALNDVRELSNNVSEKDCSQCWYYGYASRTTDELNRVVALVQRILNITKLEGLNKHTYEADGNNGIAGGEVIDSIVNACEQAGFKRTHYPYQP